MNCPREHDRTRGPTSHLPYSGVVEVEITHPTQTHTHTHVHVHISTLAHPHPHPHSALWQVIELALRTFKLESWPSFHQLRHLPEQKNRSDLGVVGKD